MYKLHLILKYLRRRRIAWVSLLAVMLCTTMVIVVISIMGGWLRMYETNARGMTGDVVVRAMGLSGFAYYEEMVEKIERLPYVEAAVPQIHVPGLAAIYNGPNNAVKTDPVQVFGVQIDRVGLVNDWPKSLYLQHTRYTEKGEPPPEAKSFASRRTEADIEVEKLPEEMADLPYALLAAVLPGYSHDTQLVLGPVWDRMRFFRAWFRDAKDPSAAPTPGGFIYIYAAPGQPSVTLSDADVKALDSLSTDKKWIAKVRSLASLVNRQGLIAGARLIDIKRDVTGKIVGRDPFKYRDVWVKLTVLGIGKDEQIRLEQKGEPEFWVVDDSRTGMWQYDNNSVYVDFHRIQTELNMQAKPSAAPKGTFRAWLGMPAIEPARTTEINIRLKPAANLEAARKEIDDLVQDILDRHEDGSFRNVDRRPRIETWRQASRTYLDAIEKEKGLVVLLFGIISLVAVFLIFCIFYMIVAEKTKDIGIIKSVGATNGGVAGIFLGYGLAIGIVGAALGLLTSYLIVHNINEIHDWMGRSLGLVVWNPEVYAFDSIPNQMQTHEVLVIMAVAVLASVLGALVPAFRAARMHPIEALRWE